MYTNDCRSIVTRCHLCAVFCFCYRSDVSSVTVCEAWVVSHDNCIAVGWNRRQWFLLVLSPTRSCDCSSPGRPECLYINISGDCLDESRLCFPSQFTIIAATELITMAEADQGRKTIVVVGLGMVGIGTL